MSVISLDLHKAPTPTCCDGLVLYRTQCLLSRGSTVASEMIHTSSLPRFYYAFVNFFTHYLPYMLQPYLMQVIC
jgi:hypothetical protein